MSLSKISGDFLEKAVCNHLLDRGLICMNPQKMMKLSTHRASSLPPPDLSCLNKVLPPHADHFYVTSCVEGKKGYTSDVRVHNAYGHQLGISCKRNNMSIKHPSARSLMTHAESSDALKHAYQQTYSNIVKEIFEKSQKNNTPTFKELGKPTKESYYLALNENVKTFLKKCNSYQLLALAMYLLSMRDPNLHIVHWNDQHPQAHLFRFDFNDKFGCIDPSTWEQLTPSTFQISAGDVILTMRLHNTTSTIKETMSFQYDTRIKNFDKVCPKII